MAEFTSILSTMQQQLNQQIHLYCGHAQAQVDRLGQAFSMGKGFQVRSLQCNPSSQLSLTVVGVQVATQGHPMIPRQVVNMAPILRAALVGTLLMAAQVLKAGCHDWVGAGQHREETCINSKWLDGQLAR